MIGSSDNSGGVEIGALVCGTEYSGFKWALPFNERIPPMDDC